MGRRHPSRWIAGPHRPGSVRWAVRAVATTLLGVLLAAGLLQSTHVMDGARLALADRRWPAGELDRRVVAVAPGVRIARGHGGGDPSVAVPFDTPATDALLDPVAPVPELDDSWIDASLATAEDAADAGARAVVLTEPDPRLWSSPRLGALVDRGVCVVASVTDGSGRVEYIQVLDDGREATAVMGGIPPTAPGVHPAHTILRVERGVARAVPASVITEDPELAGSSPVLPALSVATASCLEDDAPATITGRWLTIGALEVGLTSWGDRYVVPIAADPDAADGLTPPGQPLGQVSRAALTDAAVLIGRDRARMAEALTIADVEDEMSPVVFQRHAVSGLLGERTVHDQSGGQIALICGVLALLAAAAIVLLPRAIALAVVGMATAGWWVAFHRLPSADVRPDFVTPFVAVAVACLIALVLRWRREDREARRLVDLLTQYVPATVARDLIAQNRRRDLPTGSVTFVLTDIVDSTEAWEEAPEAMLAATRHHDELVADVFEANGGWLVRPRGEGDSRFGVFAEPAGAARAAVELQDRLRNERWETPWPLRVRVGLHTGQADLLDGDFYGSPVNRCARIRSLAAAGAVLASDATAVLVRRANADDLEFLDQGEHVLRGLRQPEHLWEVRRAARLA